VKEELAALVVGILAIGLAFVDSDAVAAKGLQQTAADAASCTYRCSCVSTSVGCLSVIRIDRCGVRPVVITGRSESN